MARLIDLACGRCDERHDAAALQTVCTGCGGPLLARYDLESAGLPSLADVLARPPGQFRLPELLPTLARGLPASHN